MNKVILIIILTCLISGNLIAQPRALVERPPSDEIFHKYHSDGYSSPTGSDVDSGLYAGLDKACRRDYAFRILFYGQSITEQGWWRRVSEYLKSEYRNTRFEIENKAIGGHPVNMLIKTAEADIYKYNPDLIIFHAYGPHHSYEDFIKNVRERTTSDVVIASDHVTADPQIREQTSYWKLMIWRHTRWMTWFWGGQPDYTWEAWMNYVFLPSIASKYKLEFIDVRSQWKRYVVDNNLKSKDLLMDSVHLNANGEYLMAEIIKSRLSKARLPNFGCENNNIYRVDPKKIKFDGGVDYKIKINGNRLELGFSGVGGSEMSIKIDGRPPSQYYKAFGFNRSSLYPGTTWPALLEIHKGPATPQEEAWSACVEPSKNGQEWNKFSVTGSSTGFDGSGQTNREFISDSGRILIGPDDWNLNYSKKVWGMDLEVKTCFFWDSLGPGPDKFSPQKLPADDVLSLSGLSNGRHTIELRGRDLSYVTSFRVFRPPLKCVGYYSIEYCYFP